MLIVAGIVVGLATRYGTRAYRPWAWNAGIHDFGLANSLPSLGGTVAVMLLFAGLFTRSSGAALQLAVGGGAGLLAYEFMQPFLHSGVFDWSDVIWTVLGGLVALAFIWWLARGALAQPQSNISLQRP